MVQPVKSYVSQTDTTNTQKSTEQQSAYKTPLTVDPYKVKKTANSLEEMIEQQKAMAAQLNPEKAARDAAEAVRNAAEAEAEA